MPRFIDPIQKFLEDRDPAMIAQCIMEAETENKQEYRSWTLLFNGYYNNDTADAADWYRISRIIRKTLTVKEYLREYGIKPDYCEVHEIEKTVTEDIRPVVDGESWKLTVDLDGRTYLFTIFTVA